MTRNSPTFPDPYISDENLLTALKDENLVNDQTYLYIKENWDKHSEKLRRNNSRREKDAKRPTVHSPDAVDIILSMGIQTSDEIPLTAEKIVQAVSCRINIPFKHLDSRDLVSNCEVFRWKTCEITY